MSKVILKDKIAYTLILLIIHSQQYGVQYIYTEQNMNQRHKLSLCFILPLCYYIASAASVRAQTSGQSSSQQSKKTETLSVTSYTRTQGGDSLYGSFEGGTSITISGYGFDKNSLTNNKVYLGSYPCVVTQATREQIICITSAYGNYSNQASEGLNLKVMVGSASVTSSSGQSFAYYIGYTPKLKQIYPSTISGNQTKLKLYGMHNIYRIGDQRKASGQSFKITIGNYVCGRTGYPYQYLAQSSYTFLGCTIDGTVMEAGKYNVSQWVSNGYAYHQTQLKKKNIYRNQTYQFVILPTIQKVSPPNGTGQILNIKGYGFTTNASRIKVQLDGRKCQIRQSDINQIQCRLSERRQGSTSRLLTNTTLTQKLGYIGGSGWKYTRYSYNYAGDIRDIRQLFLVQNYSSVPIEDSIKNQLFTISHDYIQSFMDVYKGYFKAPKTGEFVFRGFGQTKFALFISKVYGSAQLIDNHTAAIYSNSETGNTSHAIVIRDKIISSPLYMQQGKYYYMQLYHSHTYTYDYTIYQPTGGYLQISVQVPNNITTIPGQIYAVHRLISTFSPDPQIIQFVQQGAQSGTIQLSLTRITADFQVYYSWSTNINYNEEILSFLAKLRGCSGFYQYTIDGKRFVYDQAGNNITAQVDNTSDYSRAYRFVWRVFIYSKRTNQHVAQTFSVQYNIVGSQYFSQQTVQAFSSLISGTFKIQFGGLQLSYINPRTNQNTTNFDYNVDASYIEQTLKKINGLKNIRVTREGDPNYGANWTIFYQKYTAEPPLPIFDSTGLQGGRAGTSPNITAISLQAYKTNIVNLVDYNFLFTASQKPKIKVTIDNNFMSVCKSPQCQYTYNQNTPIVNQINFNISHPQTNITLNILTGYNANISTISIKQKYSGSLCSIPSNQSLPSFKCLLQTFSTDSSPKLYAGPIQFQIFAQGIGYLDKNVNITAININLTVFNITPNNGSIFGGYNLTIYGKGFHYYDLSLINVQVCNQSAQVIDADILRIVVVAPACANFGNYSVIVQSNNVTANSQLLFTYNAPPPAQPPLFINSSTPSSLNPALKQPIVLTGLNFGNDSSILTVTISRDDGKKSYRLKILKLNDTTITIGFPGSLPGRYKINIKKTLNNSVIYSRANQTGTDLIKVGVFVYSVSPSQGSPYGGTEITINGQNFSTDQLDNLINIGQKSNTLCDILLINSSQIRCRTPPQPPSYSNSSQMVYVTTKITQDSVCMNSTTMCGFSYINPSGYVGPMLTNITKTAYNLSTQTVTLQTNNQSAWPSNYQIILRNQATNVQKNITSFSAPTQLSLTFALPSIQSGVYQFFIRTASGSSNSIQITRALWVNTSSSFQMTQKGGYLQITGIGLPETIDSALFKFTYTPISSQIRVGVSLAATSPTSTTLLLTTKSFINSNEYGSLTIQSPLSSSSVTFYIYFTAQPLNTDTLIYTPSTAGNNITFSYTNTTIVSMFRIISKKNTEIYYDVSNFTYVNNKINFTQFLYAGGYTLWVHFNGNSVTYKGWYQVSTAINITRPSINSLNYTYGGNIGKNGALIGIYNMSNYIGNNTQMKINNQIAKLYKTENSTTYFYVPPYIQQSRSTPTTSSTSQYSQSNNSTPISSSYISRTANLLTLLKQNSYPYSIISDMQTQYNKYGHTAFDDDRTQKYKSTNNNLQCFVGINITANNVMFRLTDLYLELGKDNRGIFENIVFQGSVDGSTWQRILAINGQNIRQKYKYKRQDYDQDQARQQQRSSPTPSNSIFNATADTVSLGVFKALRARDPTGRSQCQVDLIQFIGQIFTMNITTALSSSLNTTTASTNNTNYTQSVSTGPFQIQLSDGLITQSIPSSYYYTDNSTPIITSVYPKTGHFLGDYNITITGINLLAIRSSITVILATIPCIIMQNNSTNIICNVQQRPDYVENQYMEIWINGSSAIIQDNVQFMYVMRWSDQKTWGMSFKPQNGDLVHVPKGQTLWVDQSTPNLIGIVVQGRIIFSDQVPMVITTDFILVNRGQFIAGTADKPYQNNLLFNLTGWQRTPRQPIYGTKVIACEACKFSMHAKGVANFRWGSLNTTLTQGDQIIDLDITVPDTYANSVNGAKIVLASTSQYSQQAQVLTITDTTSGNLYVQGSARFKHLKTFINGTTISGQVGLLTSNIRIQGYVSYPTQTFGAKLMHRGQPNIDGSYFKISNIQITKCGQPNVFKHHCITILNSGLNSQSYIKNSSIYDTYSRGIHMAGQILDFSIQGNLLYQTSGHSIQFEDILAADNSVKNNLIINPVASWQITQRDATPAAIHLRGPMNRLQGNHLAGGPYFGIWFDLQVSQTGKQCAWGLKYNQKSKNNIIHSFSYSAIHIDKLTPSKSSCRTQSQISLSSIFHSYILYNNNIGLQALYTNNIIFSNILSIQNNVHFYQYDAKVYGNISMLINSTFVGKFDQGSNQNIQQNFIQLPCNNGFIMSGLNFYNITNNGSSLLQTCNPDWASYNSVDQVFINKTKYRNVQAIAIKPNYDQLVIIYDQDGTFSAGTNSTLARLLYTQSPQSSTIIPAFSYLSNPNCQPYTSSSSSLSSSSSSISFQNWLRCNTSSSSLTKIRKLQLYYNSNYWYTGFYITKLINSTSSNLTLQYKYYPYRTNIFQIIVIMGSYYQFYWDRSFYYDFSNLNVKFIGVYTLGDGAVVLRHNYQMNRQIFQVKIIQNGIIATVQNNTQRGNPLNISTCNFGDFYHLNNYRVFSLCVSDRQARPNQQIRVNPIYCRYQCPTQDPSNDGGCNVEQEPRFRLWSNVTQWPNGTLPRNGDNVTIRKQWKVIMDVAPAKINYFFIKGTLIIPNDTPNDTITIQANMIWVTGILKAGNSSLPFPKNLIIKINGDMNNMPLTVDAGQDGNKMIVVTGTLALYGNPPSTVWTRLVQTAYAGSNTIKVVRNIGWNIGDQLVLGPSFSNPSQTQYIKITNITSNIITFTPSLNYTHYGSSSGTTSQQYGQQIDARTAVGHLTRNIKIINGGSQNWGYRMLIYGYSQCNAAKFGVIKLSGVQLLNGGQPYPIYYKPKPTIHFKRLTQPPVKSQITSCSIHHCKSRCLIIQNSQNIKLNNNVFASGTNMHIQITGTSVSNLAITYNLMIYVRAAYGNYSNGSNSGAINKVACFQWKSQVYKSTTTNSLVSNNLCQGSQGAGFSRYYQKCSKIRDSVYDKNTVGSAQIGYMLFGESPCSAVQNLTAYGCQIGVLGSPKSPELIYSNLLIIDTKIGVALRISSKKLDQSATIKLSYISAIQRPSCSYCYNNTLINSSLTQSSSCSDQTAIYMFVPTQQYSWITSQRYLTYDASLAEIFTMAAFDGKAFIINCTFNNYRLSYYNQTGLELCGNNYVMRAPQAASEFIASHHLYNSTCLQCSLQSIAQFTQPNPGQTGNLSACGQFQCTGRYNYYIQDHTGHLFANLSSSYNNSNNTFINNFNGRILLPPQNPLTQYLYNNSLIDNGTCQLISQSSNSSDGNSGALCGGNIFYIMEFQSIGTDYDSRILWPVYVTTFNMSYWTDTYYVYDWTNNTNTTNNSTTTNSTTTNNTTNSTTSNNTTNNTSNSTSNTTSNSTSNTTTNSSSNTTSTQSSSPYDIPTPDPDWLSKLNAYKQWHYNGITGLPQYTRLNRFNTLLLANQTYNITFNSTPPRDMRFQLQKRQYPGAQISTINTSNTTNTTSNTTTTSLSSDTGNTDWAIIKLYYPIPNSIRITVNDVNIQPTTHLQNNIQNSLINQISVCGANKYYFKHRTLDFVINSNQGCRPRITITNSIQLTAKFNMDIQQFYTMDGKTQFIDRMVALLGIQDRSRVKVVGVYRGSVVIQSFIQDNSTVTQANAGNASYNMQASNIVLLSQSIDNLYSTGAIQTAFSSIGFGQVIIFNSNVRLYDTISTTPSSTDSSSSNAPELPTVNIAGNTVNIFLIIGASVGGFVVILLVSCVLYFKRKNKIQNQLKDIQMSEKSQEKRLAKKHKSMENSSLTIIDID